MNELAKRIITAGIGGTIFLLAIFWQPWSMVFAFGVIALCSLWEFFTIHSRSQGTTTTGKAVRVAVAFLIFALPVGSAMASMDLFVILLILVPIGLLIKELFRGTGHPFDNVGVELLGALYISLPMALLVFIGIGTFTGHEFHPLHAAAILFMIWANDIGAYFAGSTFGKHPLFPRISPKKSWEGFFGGMLTSLVVAFLCSEFITDPLGGQFSLAEPENELIHWMVIGLICSIFGPLGDLVESSLKRSKGIKDSGTILPGHGGFLDRFDALFLATPVVFVYLLWIS